MIRVVQDPTYLQKHIITSCFSFLMTFLSFIIKFFSSSRNFLRLTIFNDQTHFVTTLMRALHEYRSQRRPLWLIHLMTITWLRFLIYSFRSSLTNPLLHINKQTFYFFCFSFCVATFFLISHTTPSCRFFSGFKGYFLELQPPSTFKGSI